MATNDRSRALEIGTPAEAGGRFLKYLSLLALLLISDLPLQGACAAESLAVTSYLDARAAQVGTAERATRQYVRDTRTERGCLEVLGLQEIGRPARLILIERWADQAAFDA